MKDYLGKRLKQDVFNAAGLVILPAGTLIREEHIGLLGKHGIQEGDLSFTANKDDQLITGEGHRSGSAADSLSWAVRTAAEQSKALFGKAAHTRKIPVMEFRNAILPAVQQIAANEDVFALFEAVKAQDEYTYQHNIGVGVLSTLIGKWMGLDETELGLLSLGATLHDVGKVNIPLEILNKPGKLTKEEYELIKKHTIYGYGLLKETVGLNYRVALIALQHHEREDGQGYPLGLRKDQTDLFSKIVAVADIFHAMSSRRPYHEPMPFTGVVEQMRQGVFGQLNPEIVTVFLNGIAQRLLGREVLLSDGRVGEVVLIHSHDKTAPLVKTGSSFVDLSKERHLSIQTVAV
ncbi:MULTISPECIES: HD-GYP domain-containing protein [Paenibacillus]|uniref:HD-GYP domain-containing protein n=1 Tax=Paenibacillus TaxID=44249 RepID=UPI0022B8EA7B|nr:HD-GYP domain-containing protein [Paenibacillus caseinilyticus]MCZ8522558.1 HD-GYP domain-containing protein [Paenibacillus caseinilyticus]